MLKGSSFLFCNPGRALAVARSGGSVRWQSPACPSLAPSLRNKYIHHCTNILIQKQHCSECLHRLCCKDQPSKPLLLLGGGGPKGWGPVRINGRAKVLAFWLERDPHINPSQDHGQSSRGAGGAPARLHPRSQAQTRVLWSEPTDTPFCAS